ncbi:MAG: hypothetical protein AB7I36_18475 [Rhodospirillaceae bacterium]
MAVKLTIARVLLFCVALVLSACASIPLSSLPDLARIDFMTTDMEVLRVALRMPEAIRPRPQGVVMDAVLTVQGVQTKTPFRLTPDDSGEPRPGLETAARPGMAVHVYRLAASDTARFNALRRDVLKAQADGRRASLGLGIETREFCSTGPVTEGALPASTFLLTSETGRFVLLVSDYDLRRNEATRPQLATLDAC